MLNHLVFTGIAATTLMVVLIPGPAVLLRGLIAGIAAMLLALFWEWAQAEPERLAQRSVIFALAFVVVVLAYREAVSLIWTLSR